MQGGPVPNENATISDEIFQRPIEQLSFYGDNVSVKGL